MTATKAAIAATINPMKATKRSLIIQLQSENPVETRALLSCHGFLPRATGIMPDDSRAVYLMPDEIESVCASIQAAPILDCDKRGICEALASFREP